MDKEALATAVPSLVKAVVSTLQNQGFAAYVVGGAIRDLLRGVPSKEITDWDVATQAEPETILTLFPNARLTGRNFGTVTLPAAELTIEITPFRAEAQYTDGRHPQQVTFGVSLEADLTRRDFTINAIAFDPCQRVIVDPFAGQADLAAKVIRAVGDPALRLAEDYLRLLRAVRLATTLNFMLEPGLLAACRDLAPAIAKVAPERSRDELSKIMLADPFAGMELLRHTGLLQILIPELLAGYGVKQFQGYHRYDVYYHNLRTAAAMPAKLSWRWAGLLHDAGKPSCWVEEKGIPSFPQHEEHSAALVEQVLNRLRYPQSLVKEVTRLVRWHMFDARQWDEVAMRRFLAHIGPDLLPGLLHLRRADIEGAGQRMSPQTAAKLKALEQVWRSNPPLTRADLALNGHDLLALGINPGPKQGEILDALLAEVLIEPKRNTRAYLYARAKSMV